MAIEVEDRQTTIQKKMLCIIMGIIFGVLFLSYVLQAIASYAGIRSGLNQQVSLLADNIVQDITAPLERGDLKATSATVQSMAYQNAIGRVCVYNPTGYLLTGYIRANLEGGFLLGRAVMECPRTPADWNDESFWHGIHIVMPVEKDGLQLGTFFLDYHLVDVHRIFLKNQIYNLVIFLLAMVGAYIAAMAAQRYITRPIIYLSKVAETLGKTKDFSIRAQKFGNDETGVLVDAFNSMLDGLEQRDKEIVQARIEANAASEMKGQFLATMSHEIRTPMTGILGMAELLLDSPLDKRQKEHVRTIVNSSESLLNIINDILDFSKIEAGKLELEYTPINLLELIDDIGMLYSVQAREKAIELVVHFHPGTEQFIFADPVRLRQIISNLLSNAIKFTNHGYILLSVEENALSGLPHDKVELVFKVKDTGIGIPIDVQDGIFETFSQVDASTTRKFGGTGLGLSICRNLLDMMGGQIMVESREGSGTTFTVSVPFTRNKNVPRNAPQATSLEGRRVIVVDDLEVNVQLIREQLEPAGVYCDGALEGREALRKMGDAVASGKAYDIAIIDYLMPDMNGEMLACAIKDDPCLADCCLVMLTAAGNPITAQNYVDKGFSAHIAKPVQRDIFLDALSFVWGQYSEGHKHELIRYEGQDIKDPSSKDDPKLPGVHILMAEDNLVNQAFIQEILEEAECEVTIAQNGVEAIEAVREQDFDLVLMDCLMPVMDGFEASRKIERLKKQGLINSKLPVVALTANAMKGDRDKCLAAGMCDYLSKPVRKRELKEMVYKWVAANIEAQGADEGSGEDTTPCSKADETPVVSGAGVLDSIAVASARDILKDKYDTMIDVYMKGSRERVEDIIKALNAHDIESVIRPAHTLKSSSRQMGAIRISDLAMDIEKAARIIAEQTPGNDKQATELLIDDIEEAAEKLALVLEETEKAFREMG